MDLPFRREEKGATAHAPYNAEVSEKRVNLPSGEVMEGQICVTPGCSQPASLRCPTCVKQDINGSFFCTQVSERC